MAFDDLELKWELGVVVVVKEREMEIGYPTDVKHVAHIGLDAAAGSAPSWVCSPHIPHSMFSGSLFILISKC